MRSNNMSASALVRSRACADTALVRLDKTRGQSDERRFGRRLWSRSLYTLYHLNADLLPQEEKPPGTSLGEDMRCPFASSRVRETALSTAVSGGVGEPLRIALLGFVDGLILLLEVWGLMTRDDTLLLGGLPILPCRSPS